ncbi:hypothetical protein [Sandaracinobacteroides sayramensis]|nr:hypothetical protein [Sandaracinobacteroides sayramensis]
MNWSPDEEQAYVARRRKRNLVIGLVLGAFACLFYGITISRMAG